MMRMMMMSEGCEVGRCWLAKGESEGACSFEQSCGMMVDGGSDQP